MTSALHHDPGAWLRRLRGDGDAAGIERDLRWLEGPGRHLLTAGDPHYPPQLAAIPGCPSARPPPASRPKHRHF